MFARFACFAVAVVMSVPLGTGLIPVGCNRADAACGTCWNGNAGSDYTDKHGKYHCLRC